jgi:hypothetical protein
MCTSTIPSLLLYTVDGSPTWASPSVMWATSPPSARTGFCTIVTVSTPGCVDLCSSTWSDNMDESEDVCESVCLSGPVSACPADASDSSIQCYPNSVAGDSLSYYSCDSMGGSSATQFVPQGLVCRSGALIRPSNPAINICSRSGLAPRASLGCFSAPRVSALSSLSAVVTPIRACPGFPNIPLATRAHSNTLLTVSPTSMLINVQTNGIIVNFTENAIGQPVCCVFCISGAFLILCLQLFMRLFCMRLSHSSLYVFRWKQ